MYDDEDYAASRLVGTIVLHKGKAVTVLNIDEKLRCSVDTLLPPKGTLRVNLSDLTLRGHRLGWVNTREGATYLRRSPMREDWRQGLRPNNVRDARGWRVDEEDIAKCLEGNYPSHEKALLMLRSGLAVIAVDRDYAVARVDGELLLRYKWYGVVGVLTSKKVKLLTKFSYLAKDLRGLYECV